MPPKKKREKVIKYTTFTKVLDKALQAVCTCGWESPVISQVDADGNNVTSQAMYLAIAEIESHTEHNKEKS